MVIVSRPRIRHGTKRAGKRCYVEGERAREGSAGVGTEARFWIGVDKVGQGAVLLATARAAGVADRSCDNWLSPPSPKAPRPGQSKHKTPRPSVAGRPWFNRLPGLCQQRRVTEAQAPMLSLESPLVSPVVHSAASTASSSPRAPAPLQS
jgi:hypothetical protein